MELTV